MTNLEKKKNNDNNEMNLLWKVHFLNRLRTNKIMLGLDKYLKTSVNKIYNKRKVTKRKSNLKKNESKWKVWKNVDKKK